MQDQVIVIDVVIVDVLKVFRCEGTRLGYPGVLLRIDKLVSLVSPVMDLVVELVEQVRMSPRNQLRNKEVLRAAFPLVLERQSIAVEFAAPGAVTDWLARSASVLVEQGVEWAQVRQFTWAVLEAP